MRTSHLLRTSTPLALLTSTLLSGCIIVAGDDHDEHDWDEGGHAGECDACGDDLVDIGAVHEAGARAVAEVVAVLDGFHDAASKADGERYFGLMTANGVFLGTDSTERWTRDEFRAYADPYFSKGQGWTYTVEERNVGFGPSGDVAWFDERLWNDTYGDCRGTGALVRENGKWRIAQYNLTFPIPNELAADFVAKIRELDGGAR